MKTYLIVVTLLITTLGYSQSEFKTLEESTKFALKTNKQILMLHVDNSESAKSILNKVNHLSDSFIIHTVNMSENSNLTDSQRTMNLRLDGSFNGDQVYPTLHVLTKSGEKTGVSFSGSSESKLNQFISTLKPQ